LVCAAAVAHGNAVSSDATATIERTVRNIESSL
jgi:hypothetical protein